MSDLFVASAEGVACTNLVRHLESLDALSPETTGTYVVRDTEAARGVVYVEGGKLCWAAAQGMGRRLKQLLCEFDEAGKLRPEMLRRICQHCRDEQVPLSKVLVSQQIISYEALRNALARHTAESLLRLSPLLVSSPDWVPHAAGSFHPMFSFEGIEAAAWIGGVLHDDVQSAARRLLAKTVPADCFAAAFAWPQSHMDQLPVLITSAVNRSTRLALGLGTWAREQLQDLHVAGGATSYAVAIANDGSSAVAWPFAAGYCVALCEQPGHLARLISNLSRKQDE